MSKNLCLILVCAMGLLSCRQQQNRGSNEKDGGGFFTEVLPQSQGGRLDVLVIAKESLWQDVAGETFRKYFTKAQPGLPQPEPLFNVRQVEPHQFSDLLKRARNLVIIKKGESGFSLQRQVYAKPQLVFRFSAPDEFELGELIAQHQEEMMEVLRRSEVEHLQKRLVKKHHQVHEVLENHHVKLKIPVDYELERAGENVLVYWKTGMKSDQGIIVHFEPLDESEALIAERIIPLRDSLTQLYIKGEKEGSYMQVEGLIAPTFENIEIDGHFAIETRGLWRTKGDFMGGAFVNYSIFDEVNDQRIMLDGFVFAPDMSKRNLLLELEAILRTFESTN